ncbi:MAG: carboxypeptidase regulatory-like domain-containing protein [Gemmatimonadaceae bacterium]|nr:carboxypeptidase regulatory-like domain-containing protein [Gemmatimonadaceae bacterium]
MRLRFVPLAIMFVLSAPSVAAQSAGERMPGMRVSGTVHDSVAHTPLAGAWVQLAGADSAAQGRGARTAISDTLGRYAFDDVPEGRYRLGFFHAVLDSLGVELPLRDLTVRRGRSARADLAVPSGGTLRALICGVRSPRDSGVVVSGGAVIGVVREARSGAPAEGVTVSGEWLEISFQTRGIGRQRPRVVVTTGANGWFALCNAPANGNIFLTASRGADSTDLVEAAVPIEGFLRRDLYLGAAHTVVVRDTTPRPDSLALPPRIVRSGEGRISGTVLNAVDKRPLAGAIVHLSDGPTARADERGAWTLANAPLGTRVLEVRSVGYYPDRRAVHVVSGMPPVQVALSTFTSVLDTVKITAQYVADRHGSGFEDRKRSGLGKMLTSEDLERRGAIFTSDAFRNLAGTRLERDEIGRRHIYVRSAFGDWCEPSVHIDGLYMWNLTADDIDGMVSLRYVKGIEVYTQETTPAEYQRAMTGCGTILIWTK